MSDALLKHNLHLLINAHWSPLYPFLIGITTWFVRPSAYWELPVVHALNVVFSSGRLHPLNFFCARSSEFSDRELNIQILSLRSPYPYGCGNF